MHGVRLAPERSEGAKRRAIKGHIVTSIVLVHYDMCDLSGLLLHGMKLAPERSEVTIVYYFIARLHKSAVMPTRASSSPFLHGEVSARA